MKLPKIMAALAGWWLIWELFFTMGINLLELLGIDVFFNVMGFNIDVLLTLRIIFVAGFLIAFLYWNSLSNREQKQARRLI